MKRIAIVILAMTLACGLIFVGCNKDGDKKSGKDYSEFAFTGISWVRETESDTETIRFGADGSFSYSCACGNPVNDADLCEGYTYDDATKTITLECIEESEGMITVIKIVKCENGELQLDFDGDIRTFTANTDNE